jgi:hypothetical protein
MTPGGRQGARRGGSHSLVSPEVDELTSETTVAVAVPDHGQPVRVAVMAELSPPFPKARGAPSGTVEVTAGADPEAGEPLPWPLICPPSETIDCHVPLVPE